MQYMYYGRHDGSKPREGVHYMMLDEYIKAKVDKKVEIIYEDMKEKINGMINSNNKEMKSLKKKLKEINEKIEKIEKNVLPKKSDK